VRDNLELSIADLLDVDVVAEVVGTAFDLDAVVQELLERRQVEDLVADRLAAVDRVLLQHRLAPQSPNTNDSESKR
jgi:hypothetical protein